MSSETTQVENVQTETTQSEVNIVPPIDISGLTSGSVPSYSVPSYSVPSDSATSFGSSDPFTPPRNGSFTEYHVTSGIAVSEVDDFDERILESDTFKWRELSDLSSSSHNKSDSDDDMPPLIPDSDDSDESNTEQHESESEKDPVPTPPVRSVPPLITTLSILLFILHLIYHAQLLHEKNEREKNPCFLLRF